MAITNQQQRRTGNVTRIIVESDLVGEIFFHWYVDGAYVGVTLQGQREFRLDAGEEFVVDVIDTIDPDFDPIANAPQAWPARRTIWWVQSQDPDIDHYRVLQIAGGLPSEICRIPHDPAKWTYSCLSPRLPDLALLRFFVLPVDQSGNVGQSIEIQSPGHTVVRTPDSPAFNVTFDPGTSRVTITEAA
ncbi:MAG: hypothetical protein MI923_20415 [Phycisphaerales bacterium]|nr:hypothetical protein [Phycisphaerales bacterium]